MAGIDPKQAVRTQLRRHPRVEYQDLHGTEEARRLIAEAMPPIVPFGDNHYEGCIPILDWDHRLPSKTLVMRLYFYYSKASLQVGEAAVKRREEQLEQQDLFPEFDISDYAGLEADEAYDGELGVPDKLPEKYRLTSPWRRDVGEDQARRAEVITRESREFKALYEEIKGRPAGLGDLEAAEWASPSETGHERWGIEVWYLRSFNGMVGEGTAFLVDLAEKRVVSQREFQFRAG